MLKNSSTLPIVIAVLGLSLTGCNASTNLDADPTPTEETVTKEASLPDPVEHVIDCYVEESDYEVLDGGSAVEFDAPWIDMDPFTCVADSIGLPEATLATAKPGDKLQADGYTITIMKSGSSQRAVVERQ